MCPAYFGAAIRVISVFFLTFLAYSAICTRRHTHHSIEECLFGTSKSRGAKSPINATKGANRRNRN